MAVSGVVTRHEVDAANDFPDSGVTTLPTHRFESLDGLRGIASLVVVFAHAMLTQPFYWNLYFGPSPGPKTQSEWIISNTPIRLLWAGDKAVILFFVLSGFVLSLPWTNGRSRTYKSFFIARICRIYLPYCAAMLVAGALAVTLGGKAISGASDWINKFAWTSGIFPPTLPSVALMLGNDYSTWIDNPTWTLVWEMRVSLLFPLLVIPVVRYGLKGAIAVAIGLWAAFVWGNSIEAVIPSAGSMLGTPHKTFFYAGYFLLGIVLAVKRREITNLTSRGNGMVALALVFAGLAIWFVNWTVYRDAIKGIGAAFLLIAAISKGAPQSWLMTAPAQWLGRVSYSLYLIHVPIILVGEYLLYPRLSHYEIVAIAIPIALVAAEFFHRTIERPAQELGRSFANRSS